MRIARDQMARDQWSEFFDADFFDGGMGTPTPPPLHPLQPFDPTDIGQLKQFMISAGQRGYLPTADFIAFINRPRSVSKLQADPLPIDIPYSD